MRNTSQGSVPHLYSPDGEGIACGRSLFRPLFQFVFDSYKGKKAQQICCAFFLTNYSSAE